MFSVVGFGPKNVTSRRVKHRHAPVAITDGNEVISRVAYKTNGGIVIYTITPSSPFGEESAKRAAAQEKNIYGVVPKVFMACDEAAAAAFIQGVASKGVGPSWISTFGSSIRLRYQSG